MNDTTVISKPETNGKDSSIFGVSVRAWLACVLVGTIAATHVVVTIGIVYDAIATKDWSKVGTFANIGEPLHSMSLVALGFYFSQRNAKPA